MTHHPPIVVNTREEGSDGPLARALRVVGLESIACPMITIGPPEDPAPFVEAVRRIAEFDWVAFTSAHAIEAVSQRPEWRAAVESGSLPAVAAVGGASAERLAAQGIAVRLVPDGVGASALADAIARRVGAMRGLSVLWPRGDRAAVTFLDALEQSGAIVTSPIAYRTLPPRNESVTALKSALASTRVAAIAFCSPSSAQNVARSLGLDDLSSLRDRLQVVASIGPTTSTALHALGLAADVQAREPSMSSLADAIAAQLRVGAGDRR